MLEEFDLDRIEDIAGAREAIGRLLNLVEELAGENRRLREENQQQRDEINRLKGEQGKPSIKPNKKPATPPDGWDLRYTLCLLKIPNDYSGGLNVST